MAPIEILLGVVFTLAVGVGVALTTSGTTPAEFWIARGLFALAGAALLAAYVVWIATGPRDPSWRVLLGALVGVLAVAGTTESLFWTGFRERLATAQQLGQQTIELQPLITALKEEQAKLRNQEAASAIIGQILLQYDQLVNATQNFEKLTGSADEKDRIAAALHTIETLKVLLRSVQVVATRQGNLLIIRTAPNTFRITFAVPMRAAPAVTCNTPPGVTFNELEKTNIGVTLVFTPAAIPVDTLPPCQFSAEIMGG
jgi:hypothetical protein